MTEIDTTTRRRITWKEAAELAQLISKEMEDREVAAREKEAGPQFRIVMIVQYYDGWSGILRVPVKLDLGAALKEFVDTYYPNTAFNNLSDEWWDLHDSQTEKLKSAGYEGWDFNSLFNSWLCKNKGCEKVEYECFISDLWKYEELYK